MPGLQIGDRAPDAVVHTHDGRTIALADFRGKQAVVVYFYPRDFTPTCTREACAFRDAYEDFVAAGAAVIGVSVNSAERHQEFATAHKLPFILGSDGDGALQRAFGVPKTLWIFPGRVTYVIDKHGTIRHVFNSQLSSDRHVTEALETVKKLAAEH